MYPGVSDRTFEFCYNAEYCQLNSAVLATHSHIPSQNAEKDLGYDVEFQIHEGRFTKSLFLQHKVSYFAEKRAGRNAKFYDVYHQPYYRFPVDNEQHNVLCELSQTRGNAFTARRGFISAISLSSISAHPLLRRTRFSSIRPMLERLQNSLGTTSPTAC